MDSVWIEDVQLPRFQQLEGDLRTDVLIVGGGLAGLLCARELRASGISCVLIEENRIMSGVSGRTTAKITSQHGMIYDKLLCKFGAERAREYWRANENALQALRALAENGDCDFETQSNFLYATGNTEKLEREMVACERLNIPARWETSLPLPFPVTGAIGFDHQGQFHPLKFAKHLAKDLPVFEQTKALAFAGKKVQTPRGTITAEKMIITTHFPMLNKHGAYFLKLYQQRSYVIALENTPKMAGMYLDTEENGLSIRSAGQWLLLGGGGHRTGKQGLGWALPEAAAKQYWPDASVAARWATQDCMSLDGIPYIGLYSRSTPNLYVASGFGKWGMTSSMLAAQILSDLIRGRENPHAELFSPQRSSWHRQLLCNGVESTANLLRITKPRCPHLGCALHWNRAERSWDCACHGSRFDEKGKRLNGPATGDLKHPPQR